MRKLMLAMSLAALASGALAEPVCLSRPELRAATALAARPLLSGLADQCATIYPAVSPRLAAARGDLARRFGREADAAGPVVGGKIARLLGLGTGADARAATDAVRGLLPVLFASAVAPKLDEKACRAGDALAGAVLPLSDRQVVDVLAAFVEIWVGQGRQKAVALCEPGAEPR